MSIYQSVRRLMQANAEIRSKKKIIPKLQALVKAQQTGTMVGTYGSESTLADAIAAAGNPRDMMGHVREQTKRKFQ